MIFAFLLSVEKLNLLKENEYLQKQNEKLFSDNADLNQDSQLTKEYVPAVHKCSNLFLNMN